MGIPFLSLIFKHLVQVNQMQTGIKRMASSASNIYKSPALTHELVAKCSVSLSVRRWLRLAVDLWVEIHKTNTYFPR